MKLKLYIDFDGVILNTIDITYRILREKNIDTTSEEVYDFYKNLDWELLLREAVPINDSINNLKLLMNSNLYDVEILTHVNSIKESELKQEYLEKYVPGIKVTFVDKNTDKCDAVNCKNTILVDDYMGNLELWKAKGGIPIKFSTTDKEYDCMAIGRLDMLIDMYQEIKNLIKK